MYVLRGSLRLYYAEPLKDYIVMNYTLYIFMFIFNAPKVVGLYYNHFHLKIPRSVRKR